MEQLTLELYPLQRALHIFSKISPDPAIRAASVLNLLLEGVHTSPWQEVAWAFSSLTGDGFPLEFTFCSHDPAIRYTTEIAGAEVHEREKLKRAELLMAQLELQYSDRWSAVFHQIQATGELAYGAWISGRHGQQSDRYKLYIEVPEAGAAQAMLLLGATLGQTTLLNRSIELRMLGYEPASSRLEFYFRVQGLETWEVRRLLHKSGLATREEEFFKFLALCFTDSPDHLLPCIRSGFSLSVSFQDGTVAFSLFSPARSLWGSDRSIHQRLRSLAVQHQWLLDSYFELSQPIAESTTWNTQHSVVSFVVTAQSDPSLYIGLRPV
jgi:hypothetical protein